MFSAALPCIMPAQFRAACCRLQHWPAQALRNVVYMRHTAMMQRCKGTTVLHRHTQAVSQEAMPRRSRQVNSQMLTETTLLKSPTPDEHNPYPGSVAWAEPQQHMHQCSPQHTQPAMCKPMQGKNIPHSSHVPASAQRPASSSPPCKLPLATYILPCLRSTLGQLAATARVLHNTSAFLKALYVCMHGKHTASYMYSCELDARYKLRRTCQQRMASPAGAGRWHKPPGAQASCTETMTQVAAVKELLPTYNNATGQP
jgi:hypothetical protein